MVAFTPSCCWYMTWDYVSWISNQGQLPKLYVINTDIMTKVLNFPDILIVLMSAFPLIPFQVRDLLKDEVSLGQV